MQVPSPGWKRFVDTRQNAAFSARSFVVGIDHIILVTSSPHMTLLSVISLRRVKSRPRRPTW